MKKLIRSLVIASGGLFLAATSSDAASMSFAPTGTQLDLPETILDIKTNVGQLINFVISVDTTGIITTAPNSADDNIEINYSILVDPTELLLTNPPASNPAGIEGLTFVFGRNKRVTFITVQVKVLEGLFDDEKSDFTLKVNSAFAVRSIRRQDVSTSFGGEQKVEVQPVPEPTTIFGSAIGLCLGGWLKRKKLSQDNKTTSQH